MDGRGFNQVVFYLIYLINFFQLDQSALGLSREYLVKGKEDKIVKAYYEYMVDLAVIYGAERPRAEKELNDSLNFEIALANVSYYRLDRSNRDR